jgi:serine/tyrosine/threonine adenylyltransferase
MLRFDNQFANHFRADSQIGGPPRQLSAAFAHVQPTPVSNPALLAVSNDVASQLGLSEAQLASPEFLAVVSGNQLLAGMQAYAVNYGGHQFGHWAGQLGDGRAISLGESLNARGERLELQLKGAGPTPFSRSADGRAVLRSSLREFVCSEAMHHLGVPTTRALSLVSTGDGVVRDMFYDGNRALEPGAIVCRVAPSFIRFGNFELPSVRGDVAQLTQWVDFCIARDFPHLFALANEPTGKSFALANELTGNLCQHGLAQSPQTTAARRAQWFIEVCERTALMVAHWLRVGFVHGVMNTDNLSILGLTIDYGPYGWLENFDAGWTPNTTDSAGKRYCFGRQPEMAQFNLGCLAQALSPLFPDQEPLFEGLRRFASHFGTCHSQMNAQKLGFSDWQAGDAALLAELYALMSAAEMDMTLTFHALQQPTFAHLAPAFYQPELAQKHAAAIEHWLTRYRERSAMAAGADRARLSRMRAANPVYVPRNYLTQLAIDAATAGDLSELNALIAALREPYRERASCQRYAEKRPEWARNRAGCSMLSCSS